MNFKLDISHVSLQVTGLKIYFSGYGCTGLENETVVEKFS